MQRTKTIVLRNTFTARAKKCRHRSAACHSIPIEILSIKTLSSNWRRRLSKNYSRSATHPFVLQLGASHQQSKRKTSKVFLVINSYNTRRRKFATQIWTKFTFVLTPSEDQFFPSTLLTGAWAALQKWSYASQGARFFLLAFHPQICIDNSARRACGRRIIYVHLSHIVYLYASRGPFMRERVLFACWMGRKRGSRRFYLAAPILPRSLARATNGLV